MFWIFLFLLSVVSADGPSSFGHFEAGLPCVAGGCVNVITGAPLIHEEDLVIPGVEPLSFSRTYHYQPALLKGQTSHMAQSWDLNFSELLSKEYGGSDEVQFHHSIDSQGMFSFDVPNHSKKELFFFDVEKYGKGSTNIAHGYPSGRSALKNTYVRPNPVPPFSIEASAVVMSGNGERKSFWGSKDKNKDTFSIFLQLLETPSGFKKRFYRDKVPYKVDKVALESPTGKTIAEVGIDYLHEGQHYYKIAGWGPAGRHFALTYLKKKNDFTDQLVAVDTSDRPRISYSYLRGEHNKRLESIGLPDGRATQFSYWSEKDRWRGENGKEILLAKDSQHLHKVKTIDQPVGAKSERITTHLIQYFQDDNANLGWKQATTRVFLCEGHSDDYVFDNNFVLQEVVHYSGLEKAARIDLPKYPLKRVCDFKEKFYWNNGGEIREKVHCDSNDKPLRTVQYEYDGRGNVTKETFIGNITGTDGDDHYVKEATYSEHDGFNLLLSEKLPNGLEVRYEYMPSTNLLTKRTTLAGKEVFREEWFKYDADHCLIRSEEKSALFHRIEVVTPSTVIPFGYPLEKKIYAMTDQGEELMESFAYRYNGRGDVVFEERRDKNGQPIFTIERQFDPHGNCKDERDSLGRHITRRFDANDNCLEEAGPRPGFIKQFSYDFMNRCTEEKIIFGEHEWTTHHAYNHLNQRVKTTNFLGHETNTVYDRYGRPFEITLPPVWADETLQSPKVQKKYDTFGNEIESTDPLGHTTLKKYTAKDKPYQIIHPDNSKQSIVYSIEGLPVTVIDEEEVETSYTYDQLGRVVEKRTPFGKEHYEYQGLRLLYKIDMEGFFTKYFYDSFGRLSETKVGDRCESLAYDAMGHPFRKAHYEGDVLLSTEVSRIDPLGRTVETYLEDPSGEIFNHKQFVYDEAGNCILEWNGDAKIVRTFDGLNRVIKVVDEQGNTHRVTYDRVEFKGQRVEQKTVVDPNLQQVITTYDALGREAEILHLNPFGIEIRRKEISYDLAGNIIKEETISPNDKRTLIKEVDVRGRVVKLIEPLKKVTIMSYTATGNLKELTKPDGIKLTHIYNKGRLHILKSSDFHLDYTYYYNRRGELTRVVDQLTGKESKQKFSPVGELLKETLPTGETISYTYDGLGRMTSYSLPDGGQAVLTYNARAATSVSRLDPSGQMLYQHQYTAFDSLGNVTEEQLIGKGGTILFSFDSLYQLSAIEHPFFTQKNLLYDPAGNLVSFEKNGEALCFHYDDLYQLTSEKDHKYTYDPFHNRTSKDEDPYTVNELNQLLSCSDTTYTYDLNGNLLELENPQQKLTFTYDPLNRLTSIDNGEETATFTYDSFHRRLTRNGIPFHFCREQEIGFENSLRILGPGLGADIGAAIAIELEGTPYAPLHDHQGSIIALVDLEGNLTASWSFTAYGELLGECASPWGFSSKRQEPLTGWISFGRRDYDPSTGRWTTPDPLGFEAGLNLYTYVFNRPLTHRDPLGLKPDEAESTIDSFNDVPTQAESNEGYTFRDFLGTLLYTFYNGVESTSSVNYSDHLDRSYAQEMAICYEFLDKEKLEKEKFLSIYINGMCTDFDGFKDDLRRWASNGVNVVGIYNPTNGKGFENKLADAGRAYTGIQGKVSRKTKDSFNKCLEEIRSICPMGTRGLLIGYSEGNVILTHSLKEYSGSLEGFGYLGISSPYFERTRLSDYVYVSASNDPVFNLAPKKVDLDKILKPKSPSHITNDHSSGSPTTFPIALRLVNSFQRNNKFLPR